MKQFLYVTTLLSSAFILTACSDPNKASESNFEKALSSYYGQEKPICIDLPNSQEMPIKSQTEEKRLDALVDAGLFEKTTGPVTIRLMFAVDGKREKEVEGFIYSPTTEADNYLVETSNSFTGTSHDICFGKLSKLKVTNYTVPSEAMGITMARVHHTFEITDIPNWVNNESFKTAFSGLEHELNQNEANATLILTSKGWLHERDPNTGLR